MNIFGLYVIGEVVNVGVYGVNCFVSNFFFEMFVFGEKVVEYIFM